MIYLLIIIILIHHITKGSSLLANTVYLISDSGYISKLERSSSDLTIGWKGVGKFFLTMWFSLIPSHYFNLCIFCISLALLGLFLGLRQVSINLRSFRSSTLLKFTFADIIFSIHFKGSRSINGVVKKFIHYTKTPNAQISALWL